ncbi:MAG: PQQ-like beta-propeller repeat protein [Planctomycetes bacterium]|nr:PQQ-like beta-propeller repeat protein [Planctomycetota bacterium]
MVWKRHDFENSYGSPVLISVDGERQLVCLMAREIVAVNPANGDLLWQHPHAGQWLNNIPNPVWGADNLLFVTSEGNAGSRVLKLSRKDNKAAAKEIWSTRKFPSGTPQCSAHRRHGPWIKRRFWRDRVYGH